MLIAGKNNAMHKAIYIRICIVTSQLHILATKLVSLTYEIYVWVLLFVWKPVKSV
jgi:uncharacterized protein (DUF983 family)